jgi:sortase A
MPLMDKQQWTKDSRRPGYAVFKRGPRLGFFILVLLAVLALGGLGAYLLSASSSEDTDEESSKQIVAPAVEEQSSKETAAEEEEARRAAVVPDDPTLYLSVPRLGIYDHTVRNDDSEDALSLGAITVPGTGFPWQKEANTYIACHRIGWPGTESYHQCLNLPAMQKGDEVVVGDTYGRIYRYRVSNVFTVRPGDTWVMEPAPGRDIVSLQTCTETTADWWTIGPRLFDGGPESGRLIVQADWVG